MLFRMSNAPERIAIPDLEKKLAGKSKPVVVDVRKTAEIEESGAVPGALHIPVETEFRSACPNCLKTKNLSSIAAGEDELLGQPRRRGTQVTGL